MFKVYILYSIALDKFYIGCTSVILSERLRRHLSCHKGFTAKAKDWKVVYFESFEEKSAALMREKAIKKWKSKIRIIELVNKAL